MAIQDECQHLVKPTFRSVARASEDGDGQDVRGTEAMQIFVNDEQEQSSSTGEPRAAAKDRDEKPCGTNVEPREAWR